MLSFYIMLAAKIVYCISTLTSTIQLEIGTRLLFPAYYIISLTRKHQTVPLNWEACQKQLLCTVDLLLLFQTAEHWDQQSQQNLTILIELTIDFLFPPHSHPWIEIPAAGSLLTPNKHDAVLESMDPLNLTITKWWPKDKRLSSCWGEAVTSWPQSSFRCVEGRRIEIRQRGATLLHSFNSVWSLYAAQTHLSSL